MTEYTLRILRLKCIRTTGERSDEILIDAAPSGERQKRLYQGNFNRGTDLDLSNGIDPVPFRRSVAIMVTEEDTSTIGEEGNLLDTALDDTIGTFTVSESEAEQGRKVRILEGSNADYEIFYEVRRVAPNVERSGQVQRSQDGPILSLEDEREGFSNQRRSDLLVRCELNGALRGIELEWRYAARDGQNVGPPVAGASYVVAATSGGWRRAGLLNAQGFARISDVPVPCSQVRYWFHSDPEDYRISERYVRARNPNYNSTPTVTYSSIPITHHIERWLSGPSDWMWGAVQGDFNRNPGLGQIFFNTVLGLIPVIDQGLDARDLTANIITLVSEENAYQRWDVWLALGTTLIGCIPAVGSVIKGVVKAILGHGVQAGAALFRRIMAIMNEAGVGNAAGRFKEILEKLPQYADAAFNDLRRILEQLKANTQEVLRSTLSGVTDWLSEWLRKCLVNLDNALLALPGMLRRFKEILAEKTQGLWESRPRHSEPVGTDTRHTVNQQRADVPLENDVYPSNAPVRRRPRRRPPTGAELQRARDMRTELGSIGNRRVRRKIEDGQGNVAFADYDIDGNSGAANAFSGRDEIDGYVPYVPNEKRLLPATEAGAAGHMRDVDGEAKILENLYRNTNESSTGTVTLFTERNACSSCEGVIEQFMEERPGIEVILLENGGVVE